MKYRLVFAREALSELQEAVLWYEAEEPGIGDSLRQRAEALFERIRENPRQYPVVFRETRRAVINHFPYVVTYVIEEMTVLVTGVVHGKRHPRRWRNRN